MRGERETRGCKRKQNGGSSPHARGTLHRGVSGRACDRFIPACAGNAAHQVRLTIVNTVHPRMRGERNGKARRKGVEHGSSPHARGTPGRHPVPGRDARFIPACAGNAPGRPRASERRPVHPRMRGERSSSPSSSGGSSGSSPHARGTRRIDAEGIGCGRFIPACAGNACYGGSLRT